MSDYGDFCKEMRERRKKAKRKEFLKAHAKSGIIEKIEKAGAVELSFGIWRLGCFDIYPYKRIARNYITNRYSGVEYAIKNKDKQYCVNKNNKTKNKYIDNWIKKCNLVMKTQGVYRYDSLNIDVYPNRNWARNYKTNQKYEYDEAKNLIIKHFKESNNEKRNESVSNTTEREQ